PTYSTARRSPTQRHPVTVNPETLHDELTGQTHEPTPAKPTIASEQSSPNILDDFAASLAKQPPKSTHAAKPVAAAPPPQAAATAATSQGPSTLPSEREPSIAPEQRGPQPEPQIAEVEPTPAAKEDRYASPSFPSVGTLRESSPSTNSSAANSTATDSA